MRDKKIFTFNSYLQESCILIKVKGKQYQINTEEDKGPVCCH